MFDKIVARMSLMDYNKNRTDVLFYKISKDVCSGSTDVGTYGKATSLADLDQTAMVQTCGGDKFSLFLSKKITFFLRRILRMQEEIYFFCKKCRKSLGVTYTVTGDDNALVLPNIMIKCSHNHCKRVMFLKNYTEKKLVDNSVNGKYYM